MEKKKFSEAMKNTHLSIKANENNIYFQNININNFENTSNKINELFNDNKENSGFGDDDFSIFIKENLQSMIESDNESNNKFDNCSEEGINNKSKDKIEKLKKNIKNELNNECIERIKIGFNSSKIGNYSYFNSLIQCLANLPDLVIYFKNNVNLIKNIKIYPLTFAFFRAIECLLNNSTKNLEKKFLDFIKGVEHCFPFFKDNKNPIDLFNLLMNKIHKELNKGKIKDLIKREKADKKNLNEVIQKEIIFFNHNNDTIISNLFNIFSKKEIKCLKCNNVFYEMQNYISFDLDVIKTNKKYKKNILTINDCLNYYISPINKKLICCLCNKYSELVISKNIFSPPNNLVFIINRNNTSEEKEMMKIKFKYEENLNISDYIDKKMVEIKTEYILIGVVAFLLDKKKYVSFCKNMFDNIWMLYDEDQVNECNYDYIVNSSTPYILFYKMLE